MKEIRSGVMNFMRYVILPTIILLLLSVLLITGAYHAGRDVDLLIYVVNPGLGTYPSMLYDPHHQAYSALPDGINSINLSADGRLAYVERNEAGGIDIFIMDVLSAATPDIHISQNPSTNKYLLGWSYNGHYLAFSSSGGDDKGSLYVWDGETITNITPGETITNITPDDSQITFRYFFVEWSNDGRLAFTIVYYSVGGVLPNEIYIWDGSTTSNLSQNPTGNDSIPVWSEDGQIAFLSEQNYEYDIFVWDGVSFKNGSPDRDTFISIAPDLAYQFSYLTWTSDGLLGFSGRSSQDTLIQIYVWDAEQETTTRRRQATENVPVSWSFSGDWAFIDLLSTLETMQHIFLYVPKDENRMREILAGAYEAAWSSDGNLIFCKRGSSGWVLSIWDGKEVIELAEGNEIWAQWQSGERVYC